MARPVRVGIIGDYNPEFHTHRATDAAIQHAADALDIPAIVDIIAWNDDGKIVEFKVMIRPLKDIQIVHQKMAEALASMH